MLGISGAEWQKERVREKRCSSSRQTGNKRDERQGKDRAKTGKDGAKNRTAKKTPETLVVRRVVRTLGPWDLGTEDRKLVDLAPEQTSLLWKVWKWGAGPWKISRERWVVGEEKGVGGRAGKDVRRGKDRKRMTGCEDAGMDGTMTGEERGQRTEDRGKTKRRGDASTSCAPSVCGLSGSLSFSCPVCTITRACRALWPQHGCSLSLCLSVTTEGRRVRRQHVQLSVWMADYARPPATSYKWRSRKGPRGAPFPLESGELTQNLVLCTCLVGSYSVSRRGGGCEIKRYNLHEEPHQKTGARAFPPPTWGCVCSQSRKNNPCRVLQGRRAETGRTQAGNRQERQKQEKEKQQDKKRTDKKH